ncbi:MAG: glycosyltransferase family 2 protein [Bacteroidota bacterium]
MLFSIIIPTYNRAHILPRTIASVLAQTYADWECIIVDDGSTDETKNLIDLYADSRIRYVYQENAERSAARNNGIRHAQGEYICFLDSDDEYLPEHLEVLQREISFINSPIKGMYVVHALHNMSNEIVKPEYPPLHPGKELEYVFTNPITPTRVCIHRDVLARIQFDADICIVEDLVLWCKIAAEFPVYQIQEYTVQYHLHEDNSINLKNNSYASRYAGLTLFFKRYSYIKKQIPACTRKQVLSNTLFGIAKHYIHIGNTKKAIKHTFRALLKQPFHAMTLHRKLVLLALLGLYSKKVLKEYKK